MKRLKIEEVKKLYPQIIKAKKEWFCFGCFHIIKKGENYRQIRVNAYLPFSKATIVKPICLECAKLLEK